MSLRGDRLKKRRKALGYSQDDLAERVGTSQGQIWLYESGRGNPTADMLISLAKALDTSTDYLLGLTDTPDAAITETRLSEDEIAVLRAYRDKHSPDGLLTLWWRKWRSSSSTQTP